MRKPTFCICENKDADQRNSFRYADSTMPLLMNQNFQASSHLLQPCSLVGNQDVDFLMTRLILIVSSVSVSTSSLSLPGLDPETLLASVTLKLIG